ncbi:roadblock/LC7 domain-containing protein [Streptomyces tsukubensis]|uniref:Roadblock/LAMTOR2 domain-containing protein n=1 Tax=Streptomyces tsukubensis TaxID=83656 RepID=A0A1V4A650_9ACTN|nr:roadblock/LC7 domain-containing protein [Streptomyces tsukubensis]OON77311.1 hypothetical protein B1H18_18880 [Streptomyces tsukubensis]QFR92386.1 hypothetical protein GBW32_04105 [Streptomyces tsukubensis]
MMMPHASRPATEPFRGHEEHTQRADTLRAACRDIASVVILTAEGLPSAADRELERPVAERTASVASGLYGLARAGGELAEDAEEISEPRNVVVEYRSGLFLVVMEAGENLRLAVTTVPDADLGSVVYEMTKLSSTLSMEVAARAAATSALPR